MTTRTRRGSRRRTRTRRRIRHRRSRGPRDDPRRWRLLVSGRRLGCLFRRSRSPLSRSPLSRSPLGFCPLSRSPLGFCPSFRCLPLGLSPGRVGTRLLGLALCLGDSRRLSSRGRCFLTVAPREQSDAASAEEQSHGGENDTFGRRTLLGPCKLGLSVGCSGERRLRSGIQPRRARAGHVGSRVVRPATQGASDTEDSTDALRGEVARGGRKGREGRRKRRDVAEATLAILDQLRDIGIEPSDIPQVARDMSRRAVTGGRRNDPAPTPATDARCCA